MFVCHVWPGCFACNSEVALTLFVNCCYLLTVV